MATNVHRGVVIAWTAPTTNSDASPLTDLTAYRIYVSRLAGSYGAYTLEVSSSTTQVNGAALGLISGTYFLQVTAVDDDDNESDTSNELSVTVRIPVIILAP